MPLVSCPACLHQQVHRGSMSGALLVCEKCGRPYQLDGGRPQHVVYYAEPKKRALAIPVERIADDMPDDPALMERAISRLNRQMWLPGIRLAARRTLDLLQFGTGAGERLAAALVVGAPFFFLFLAISVAVGLPVLTGALIGAITLLVTVATSAVFVFGTPDDVLEARVAAMREDVAILRLRLDDLDEQLAANDRERYRSRPLEAECPFCCETIRYDAMKCPKCYEYLDERLRQERLADTVTWSPGVAAVLSFFIPGLGQMYKTQILNGFLWMFAVWVGYFFCIIPGLILHVVCIFDAASGRHR